MRSAFAVFSSSISGLQIATIWSSSLAITAATQGPGSIRWSAESPVAPNAAEGSAADRKTPIVTFRISTAKAYRIEFLTTRVASTLTPLDRPHPEERALARVSKDERTLV